MKTAIELFVSQKVREFRMSKHMSQEYLGECINRSRTFISNRENPNIDMWFNLENINEIAKALDCAPCDFLPKKPL